MRFFNEIMQKINIISTTNYNLLSLLLESTFIFIFYGILRKVIHHIIYKKMEGRKEYFINHTLQILLNILECLSFIIIWNNFIKNLMTLISVISAAMTIALRELILNFFCGLYINIKKPFKVEDRIEIDGIKGDVTNIFALSFEIVEVSTNELHGQSTGIIVTFPSSIVLTKPIKNITKGFKYIWDEIIIKIDLKGDLQKNKNEIYKIINNNEIIKSIPPKMKNQINYINSTNRIYYNKFDPVIYTRIVDNYIELTVRYLMHPKKARYVESEIWNKIYKSYKDNKINLYIT